jgi:transposase-like protein
MKIKQRCEVYCPECKSKSKLIEIEITSTHTSLIFECRKCKSEFLKLSRNLRVLGQEA